MRAILLSVLFPLVLGACSSPEKLAVKALAKNQYQLTAEDFLLAASVGDIPSLILFQKAGFDIDATDANGRTALIEAARKGRSDAVGWLIQAGATTTMADLRGRDALIAAAGGGYTGIVRSLLQHGADSELRDAAGWTGLSLAAYKGQAETVTLLANQADPSRLNEALLLACFIGHVETISKLLSHGADLNCKSPENLTPLMITAKKGRVDAARFLLEKRANHLAIGAGGKTAAVFAQESGFANIHELIMNGRVTEPTSDEKILRAATMAGAMTAQSPNPTTNPKPESPKKLVALKGSTLRSQSQKSDVLSAFKLIEFHEARATADACAILTAPQSGYRYLARTGDTFRTIDPANEEKTYLVVALGGEDIQLQDQKSRVTVRLGRSEKP